MNFILKYNLQMLMILSKFKLKAIIKINCGYAFLFLLIIIDINK